MTAENLLKPRWIVIADFPNSDFKVGEIEDRDWCQYPDGDDTQKPIWQISDFPHLFKKLNWWEHRKAEDMPKKVMSLADDKKEVYEIEEWDMNLLLGWIDKEKRSCCDLTLFNPEYGYVPVE